MSKPQCQCPVAGCDAMIKHNYLMCPPHWRRVPKILRTALREAFSEYNDAYERRLPVMPKIRALRSVQSACIEAVEAKEREEAEHG